MKNELIKVVIGIMLITLIVSPALADITVSEPELKAALKKALYDYFQNPDSPSIDIARIKSMLTVYLETPGDTTLNIADETTYNAATALSVEVPKCSDGTEYGECSWNRPQYCYAGKLVGRCHLCGCPSGKTCNIHTQKCEIGNVTTTEPTTSVMTTTTALTTTSISESPRPRDAYWANMNWSKISTTQLGSTVRLVWIIDNAENQPAYFNLYQYPASGGHRYVKYISTVVKDGMANATWTANETGIQYYFAGFLNNYLTPINGSYLSNTSNYLEIVSVTMTTTTIPTTSTTPTTIPGMTGNVIYIATQKLIGAEIGGRSGADAWCINSTPSNLPSSCNKIHAFLCVDSSDSVKNMPTNYGYNPTKPIYWWHNTNKTFNKLAENWSDMLDGSITMNQQNGTGIIYYSVPYPALTGCYADGSTYTDNCRGWTANDGKNAAGGSYDNINGYWLGGRWYINCALPASSPVRCIAECTISTTTTTTITTTVPTTTTTVPCMVSEWNRTYDSGNIDNAQAIAVDSNDNIIVTGLADLTSSDFLTVKYDSSGNQLWVRTLNEWYYSTGDKTNDYGRGVATDSDDNIIVVGTSIRDSYDLMIIKYDPDGNLLWKIAYDGGTNSTRYDQGYAVAVDSNDNIIVTGQTSWSYNYDVLLLKYDKNGNMLWKKTYDWGGYDYGRGVAIGSNNSIIITGYYGPAGNTNYLTMKYDTNGNLKWIKTYDSGSNDNAYAVATDSSDNIIVAGASWLDTWRYRTMKYDSNGNLLWNRTSNIGWAYSAAVDSSDNIIINGYCNFGTLDYFTIKYDQHGNVLWNSTYDGGKNDSGFAVATDSNDCVIVTGSSYINSQTDVLTFKYC